MPSDRFPGRTLPEGRRHALPFRTAVLAGLAILVMATMPVRAQSTPVTGQCQGGALGPAHDRPGVVCEDFDTDRNGSGAIEWTRLFPVSPVCDPLWVPGDPSDDILGNSAGGGSIPFGVAGSICSRDAQFAEAQLTCHVVPSDNDWHIHSPYEGCDTDDSYDLGDPQFDSRCAPDLRAHSGFRSLHMGRHLNATRSIYDTYRWRQTSAFVLDPVTLGAGATLEFWQILRVCDDQCVSAGYGGTTAGGQVQISVADPATGLFTPWQRLRAVENDYGSRDQEINTVCDFDPADDSLPPGNETMCGGQPQWSEQGDVYGNDLTCLHDTDGRANLNGDCGQTTNRTVDPGCSWVDDPDCGSFLEHGSVGTGVWARTRFDLSDYEARRVRLRMIFQSGGGWGFGESRSFLEPEPGLSPYMAFEQDAGWYIDDIEIANVMDPDPFCLDPDGDGYGLPGDASCPNGPAADCDCSSAAAYPGAPEICDRKDDNCDMIVPSDEIDGDGDDVTLCEGDCNDADGANIRTPPDLAGLVVTPSGNAVDLSWESEAGLAGSSTVYDVFTGLMSDLRSGGGFAAGRCLKDNTSTTIYTPHGPDPPLGDARYYIVRGQNGCPAGDGTWGDATRDAETAASSMTCD